MDGGRWGGGGGCSGRFCLLISSLNRRVRAARGRVAWPKPTSNAYVWKAKIAGLHYRTRAQLSTVLTTVYTA
jgi:hypothetical protein